MKEIKGDLWAFLNKENHVICILTNSDVKANGKAVMGRGCALQATRRFPALAGELGKLLSKKGTLANDPRFRLLRTLDKGRRLLITLGIFPTKQNWWNKARLGIINRAALDMKRIATMFPKTTFILPRPGVGNGGLEWEKVKPLLEKLPDNVLVISPKEKK